MTWVVFWGVWFVIAIIAFIDAMQEQGRKLRIEEQHLKDWYDWYRDYKDKDAR
jgi:hypothetical protein